MDDRVVEEQMTETKPNIQSDDVSVGVSAIVSTETNKRHPRPFVVSLRDRFGDMYWRSPLTMLFVFALGIACALALHGYYTKLDGQKVGNTQQQQRALRIGTALAYFSSACFIGSATFAYIQCLWRGAKKSELSVKSLDDAFQFTQSLWTFVNLEAIFKLRLAALIALVTWFLPITTVLTPATLSVEVVLAPHIETMNVPTLKMSSDNFREFAYTVNATDPKIQKFLGPRTVLTRLTVATAANGQILQLNAPYANATYEQEFYGPTVRCEDANATTATIIDATAAKRFAQLDPSVRMVSNDFIAFVPALSERNTSAPDVPMADLTDNNGGSRASNQIWIRISQTDLEHPNRDVTVAEDYRYLICEVHNATYNVNFTWSNGVQTIHNSSIQTMGPVPHPTTVSYSAADQVNTAYSAFMWALNTQIVGHLSFFQDVSSENDTAVDVNAGRIYSEIATNMEQSSLLGSSSLDSFFIKNHLLGNPDDPTLFSTQRLFDKAFARNRTLGVLIEELGFNVTMGLLSNPNFAPPSPAPVTLTRATPTYSYNARPLLITYGIAIFCTLISIILGCLAYAQNGVAHDITWSSIVCTTRGMHMGRLNAHERLGALPLAKRIKETIVRFVIPWQQQSNGQEREASVGARGQMARRRSSTTGDGGFGVVEDEVEEEQEGKQGSIPELQAL